MDANQDSPVLPRRKMLAQASVGLAAIAAGCGGGGSAATAANCVTGADGNATAKTFVLVHGAFHGGWCWNRVTPLLQAAGHRVFTPTLTGLGERKHLLSASVDVNTSVIDVANVIEAEELTNVYLVGHSFGGASLVGVADRMPQKLAKLIFLDAGIPESGLSSFDRFTQAQRDGYINLANQTSGGLSIPAPDASLFGVSNPQDLAFVNRRMTPQPLKAFSTALTYTSALGNGVPTIFVRCTQPALATIDSSAALAKRQPGWQYLELATGHDAMITAPKALADLLLSI